MYAANRKFNILISRLIHCFKLVVKPCQIEIQMSPNHYHVFIIMSPKIQIITNQNVNFTFYIALSRCLGAKILAGLKKRVLLLIIL